MEVEVSEIETNPSPLYFSMDVLLNLTGLNPRLLIPDTWSEQHRGTSSTDLAVHHQDWCFRGGLLLGGVFAHP